MFEPNMRTFNLKNFKGTYGASVVHRDDSITVSLGGGSERNGSYRVAIVDCGTSPNKRWRTRT